MMARSGRSIDACELWGYLARKLPKEIEFLKEYELQQVTMALGSDVP